MQINKMPNGIFSTSLIENLYHILYLFYPKKKEILYFPSLPSSMNNKHDN